MPFCKSPNVTLTWNFQGAPKFVLSDWKLVPPPKRTKRTEWNREKLEFSRVTLHEVTQGREQSLGPSLAPWTCLCWLTVALGKSFWLSAHLQVSHQLHLPDLPRAQVATWAGFSSPGRQELVEFPHEILSYSPGAEWQHWVLGGLMISQGQLAQQVKEGVLRHQVQNFNPITPGLENFLANSFSPSSFYIFLS